MKRIFLEVIPLVLFTVIQGLLNSQLYSSIVLCYWHYEDCLWVFLRLLLSFNNFIDSASLSVSAFNIFYGDQLLNATNYDVS